MNRRPLLRMLLKALFYFVLLLVLVYTIFPFYWAINTSLLPTREIGAVPVSYFPGSPQLTSYQQVLRNPIFLRALLNSSIVAGSATLLSLLVGSLAAYALGRFPFRGRRVMMYLILAMTMFPQIAIVGSLYRMVNAAGLFNSPLSLVLSYLLTTLPFTVWVMTVFFKSLPRDLEEAAYADGASPLQTLWIIMLPLAAPGLVTTGLLAFISSWNEYLFALSFTIDERARTVPVVVAQFSGEVRYEIPWGQIMAGSLIATVPLLILVFVFQRRIVAGLTAGAVKG